MDTTIHDERGWIKLWRKTIDSEVFANPHLFKLWLYCLLTASHKEVFIPMSGFTRPIKVGPGQFITGRYALHAAFYPKRTRAEWKQLRKTGVRPDKPVSAITLWRNLKELEKMGNIKCQNVNNRFSLITIINWEAYQGNPSEFDQPMINQRSTGDQPMNTNKNVKNEKNNTGRSKKQTDPEVRKFLNYWGEIFLQETGSPYTASFGKEGKLVKDLLNIHPLETLKELTRNFFRDRNIREQVQQGRIGYTIGIFFKEVNRLLSLKGMNPLEQAKREMFR